MNADIALQTMQTDAVLDTLPVGVAVVDADRRIMLVNSAYCASLGLPPDSFPPGTKLEDAVRTAAYRGVYGPGDPEAQLAEVIGADYSRPGRLRRRSYMGRSYDLLSAPLPHGGHVVCAVETTSLLTARDEAETTLARVTSALATLRTGLATFTADRLLLFSNPRFAELLGLPSERLQPGMAFGDLLALLAMRDEFVGRDGDAFIAAQRDADRSQPMAVRRIRTNGHVIDVSSDPLPNGGWTMAATDISPLAGAEDEARRRATILNSILEAIPHGVCVYSAERRVTMFNRAYTQAMTGAPLNVGDHLETVIRRRAEAGEYGPGDPDKIYAQQMAFDVTRAQSRKRRRPNGMTVDVRTTPLPNGGYISVVTDITPLAEAEAEVSRRAEELAVMLSCIRHGVMLWGSDHRLLASNAIAAELLRHPPGLLEPGRTQDEILENLVARGHFGKGDDGRERAGALANLDRFEPYLRQIVTPDERVLDVRSDPTPGGGWVTTLTDVTEARIAETELRRAKDAAEAANQAKSRFLATMSHELRTPLNAVIGFSDTLLREADRPSGERVAEFAQQINDAGRHLLGLINIILDVARIEFGPLRSRLGQGGCRASRAALRAPGGFGCAGGRDNTGDRRAGRSAGDQGGRTAAAAGAEPPAVERDQIHRSGRYGHHRRLAGRRRRTVAVRARYRDRHFGGRPRSRLRTFHPARQQPGSAFPGRRPGSLRLAGVRHRAWRQADPAQHPWQRDHGGDPAAGGSADNRSVAKPTAAHHSTDNRTLARNPP